MNDFNGTHTFLLKLRFNEKTSVQQNNGCVGSGHAKVTSDALGTCYKVGFFYREVNDEVTDEKKRPKRT
jgi:hypothetical protein